jgi:predicted amidohydrolase YtcJ
MARRALVHAALSVAVVTSGCSGGEKTPAPPPADLVLRNGGIYTVDAQRSWAQAAAIRDGAIVAVGDEASIAPYVGSTTRVVDLAGHIALPGLHDSHVHPIRGGLMLLGCSLDLLPSVEALVERVRECAARTQGEWVVGDNYDLSLFPEGNAHKSVLDAVVPDRPVYLRGSDGHSGWANSKALALAGIEADTPDPPKGVIERDPGTGEPSGTLRETATALIEAKIPKPTAMENAAALKAALREMASVGVTSFIDAWVSESQLQTYAAVAKEGVLSARVRTCLVHGVLGDHEGAEFDRVLASLDGYASERLDTHCIKIFLDGVLEGETAALLEPYVDSPDHRGELNLEPAALADAVSRFDAMGLQVHMHAIGDHAARAGLDAVAEARERNGERDRRHHIAHLQLVHPDDLPRFAQLGVTANFQALWAYPDTWITEINLPAVGKERVDRMYPIGSVMRAGGRIVGGSDWFVSSVNPWLAIETAVTRADAAGEIEGVLNAGERVDLATMIAAYTIEGAWLAGREKENGSIETGKRADLVVLDRNVFEVPAEQIGDAEVVLTILDGEVIYERARSGGLGRAPAGTSPTGADPGSEPPLQWKLYLNVKPIVRGWLMEMRGEPQRLLMNCSARSSQMFSIQNVAVHLSDSRPSCRSPVS